MGARSHPPLGPASIEQLRRSAEDSEAYLLEFGKSLSTLRMKTGKTCQTAATALGISPAILREYEEGMALPHLRRFVRIAELYGVAPLPTLVEIAKRAKVQVGTTHPEIVEALILFAGATPELVTAPELRKPPRRIRNRKNKIRVYGNARYLREGAPGRTLQAAEFREKYEQGKSIREVAEEVGMAYANVRNLLLESHAQLGIPGKPRVDN